MSILPDGAPVVKRTRAGAGGSGPPRWLTDDEAQRVILNVLDAADGEAVTLEELTRAVDWCHETRLNASIVDAIIDGDVRIRVPAGGEVQLRRTRGPAE